VVHEARPLGTKALARPTSSFAVSVLRKLGYRVSMVSSPLNEYFQVINDSRRRAQTGTSTIHPRQICSTNSSAVRIETR